MDWFFIIYFIVLIAFVFSYAVVFFILFLSKKQNNNNDDIEASVPENFDVTVITSDKIKQEWKKKEEAFIFVPTHTRIADAFS